jgi:hypothetical protein
MKEDQQAPNEGAHLTESAAPIQILKSVGASPQQPATEQQLENVEREMNAFERSTLRWTKATFFILGLTGLFISLQWREMNSGGLDTKALAEATGKQAAAAETLAKQAKTQTDKMAESLKQTDALIRQATQQTIATNNLAAEGKRSADIAQAQQSPWVGIEQASFITARVSSYTWTPILDGPGIWIEVGFPSRTMGQPRHSLNTKA